MPTRDRLEAIIRSVIPSPTLSRQAAEAVLEYLQSEGTQPADDFARRIVEAYGQDIITGNAPGISLQDMIEVGVQSYINQIDKLRGELEVARSFQKKLRPVE